jgi:hypothetical protein
MEPAKGGPVMPIAITLTAPNLRHSQIMETFIREKITGMAAYTIRPTLTGRAEKQTQQEKLEILLSINIGEPPSLLETITHVPAVK